MSSLLKNAALGAVGGLAGTYAMQMYWQGASAVAGEDPRQWTNEGPPHTLDEMDVAGQHHKEDESSTAAAGREAYEAATGEEPSDDTKSELSYAVHWGYGTAMGALYGVLSGGRDGAGVANGLVFGTALWLLGDELAVPLLGLSQGATAYPPAQHANRLGAHLAYGLALAAVTRTAQALVTKEEEPKSWNERLWGAAETYLKLKAGKKAAGTAWSLARR